MTTELKEKKLTTDDTEGADGRGHLERTMERLRLEIGWLTDALLVLTELQQKEDGRKGPGLEVKVVSAWDGAVLKQLEVIRGLEQPFRPKSFEDGTGMSKHEASSALMRFKRRGWLVAEGYGLYRMSAKFPAKVNGGVSKPALTPALSPRERGTTSAAGLHPVDGRPKLRAELAAALKQRDRAREAGRDAMVEMFQKDVDRLEAALGE